MTVPAPHDTVPMGDAASVPLFDVRSVTHRFESNRRFAIRGSGTLALDGIDLEIDKAQSLGIVGESGSGKTTLARMLVAFDRPSEGTISYLGNDVSKMGRRARADFRREVQMVFQNPYASLNPFRTTRDSLMAGYRAAGQVVRRERAEHLVELLGRVGLNSSMLDRYPHEFSGGQRQRIVLARALTVSPSVLIADEPVSALDVSIQAQILNLLNDLKEDATLGLTVIMVMHDLGVANFFSDRIAVMYAGRVVEVGPTAEVVNRSRHPYTRMLISAAPNPDPRVRASKPWVRSEIGVEPPTREGCVFAPRCWLRAQLDNPNQCIEERPELVTHDNGLLSACHFADEVSVAATSVMLRTETGTR